MDSINWEKQLVSIRGSRGVGKTTLMRQYIKKKYGVNAGEALYLVMDSMYFTNHTLLEVAERFHLMGGKHLFLDEVPEYKRSVLEVMRQPLEDRKITVSRQKQTVDYPASFMLVAAMNPCPCGHYGDPAHTCVCTPSQIHRYKSRISGPLLDRIDIHCSVQAVPYELLRSEQPGESSASVRERVVKARNIQQKRFDGTHIYCNAQMSAKQVRQYCAIDEAGDALLRNAMERFGLSARAYDRILKVARTIADLDGAADISAAHLMEAISYRQLDRDTWGE